jgi:hypothetical protein
MFQCSVVYELIVYGLFPLGREFLFQERRNESCRDAKYHLPVAPTFIRQLRHYFKNSKTLFPGIRYRYQCHCRRHDVFLWECFSLTPIAKFVGTYGSWRLYPQFLNASWRLSRPTLSTEMTPTG